MERIDKILNHELFLYHLSENKRQERERIFCRHTAVHFLDVARIGCLINAEEGLRISKEWIYAAALLHDLGKHIQYEDGTPHEISGAAIAKRILADCGFDTEEIEIIADAILCHRNSAVRKERNLRGVLYRADKASRACFLCDAKGECSWSDEKKNLRIRY